MIPMNIIGTPLFQWETGRQLQIIPLQNMTVSAVHFSNPGDLEALVVEPNEVDGKVVADIPNILLQKGSNIVAYSVNVSSDCVETLRECIFPVRKRAKPSDYVYTEVEILNYESLEKRIKAIEENGTSEEQIANAVEAYLLKNPVGVPSGGKAGQYLRKKSDDDRDVEWADFEIPKEYGLISYDQDRTITIT